MKNQIYVIYDRVAEESGPLFEAVNDGIAHRNYKRFLSENTAKDHFFEETDFMLLHLGEVDKNTNLINPEPPREIHISLSLLEEEEVNESI